MSKKTEHGLGIAKPLANKRVNQETCIHTFKTSHLLSYKNIHTPNATSVVLPSQNPISQELQCTVRKLSCATPIPRADADNEYSPQSSDTPFCCKKCPQHFFWCLVGNQIHGRTVVERGKEGERGREKLSNMVWRLQQPLWRNFELNWHYRNIPRDAPLREKTQPYFWHDDRQAINSEWQK